jgi:hypothetical protein
MHSGTVDSGNCYSVLISGAKADLAGEESTLKEVAKAWQERLYF